MAERQWIAIVGWKRMTHSDAKRGEGPLPWHRTYGSLLDDDGYWELSAAERGVWHGLLLLALRTPPAHREHTASVPPAYRLDTGKLSRKLGIRVTHKTLASLNQAGLIRICASKAQAERWHDASPARARVELEEEREEPLEQSRSKTTGARLSEVDDEPEWAGEAEPPPDLDEPPRWAGATDVARLEPIAELNRLAERWGS